MESPSDLDDDEDFDSEEEEGEEEDDDDEDYVVEIDDSHRGQKQQQVPSSNDDDGGVHLLVQLIKVSLKLFQDNFRLKKFCNNFKLYLEKYCEPNSGILESNNNIKQRTGEEIYAKYEQNFGNIEWQLFNDDTTVKILLGKWDLSLSPFLMYWSPKVVILLET